MSLHHHILSTNGYSTSVSFWVNAKIAPLSLVAYMLCFTSEERDWNKLRDLLASMLMSPCEDRTPSMVIRSRSREYNLLIYCSVSLSVQEEKNDWAKCQARGPFTVSLGNSIPNVIISPSTAIK